MNVNALFIKGSVVIATIVAVSPANAAIIGFVSNPTTNSVNFTNAALGQGATIDSSINFNSLPTGILNPNAYPGVTLTAVGGVDNVVFGAGPGDSNTSSTPLSPGEGPHPASNYLRDPSNPSTLTISFNNGPVNGVGLSIIDYFNPSNNNPLTIEAFTGQNGTGTSLGSFASVAFNFQTNNTYFMGLLSDTANIGSVIFTDVSDSTGDTTGIDNILIASTSTQQVPEPFTIIGTLIGGTAAFRMKKKLKDYSN
jgi:hypothetical protein